MEEVVPTSVPLEHRIPVIPIAGLIGAAAGVLGGLAGALAAETWEWSRKEYWKNRRKIAIRDAKNDQHEIAKDREIKVPDRVRSVRVFAGITVSLLAGFFTGRGLALLRGCHCKSR